MVLIGNLQDAVGVSLRAETPRIFLLVEQASQRPWLDAVLQASGLESCGFSILTALDWRSLLTLPDVWLVAHSRPLELPDFLHTEQVLRLPALSQWSDAQLSDAVYQLRHATGSQWQHTSGATPLQPVEAPFKVLLGASLGGPAALAEFLQALSPHLPIGVVVAQHIDSHMVHSLPRVLSRHNGWRAVLLDEQPMTLVAGQIVVLSTDGQLAFDDQGRLLRSTETWPPPYRPCINAAAQVAGRQWGREFCFVVLSGMGNDGAEAVTEVLRHGGQVWAQSSASAQCASQPEATLATGKVGFCGTPKQLAAQLTVWVEQQRSAGLP